MDSSPQNVVAPPASAAAATDCRMPIRLLRAAVWVAIVGAGIGTLAFFFQQHGLVPAFFYPLLFPLIVGGLAGFLAPRLVRCRWPTIAVFPSAILALVTSAMAFAIETTWAYRTYVRAAEAAIEQSPLGQMARAAAEEKVFSAAPLPQFIAAQIERSGGWWLADGALVCLAAMTVAIMTHRRKDNRQATPI